MDVKAYLKHKAAQAADLAGAELGQAAATTSSRSTKQVLGWAQKGARRFAQTFQDAQTDRDTGAGGGQLPAPDQVSTLVLRVLGSAACWDSAGVLVVVCGFSVNSGRAVPYSFCKFNTQY